MIGYDPADNLSYLSAGHMVVNSVVFIRLSVSGLELYAGLLLCSAGFFPHLICRCL